jgi:hypothetical protein
MVLRLLFKVDALLPSLSEEIRLKRDENAGIEPNTMPVTIETPSVNSSTGALILTSTARLAKRAAKVTNRLREADAKINPSAPPARLSMVLSVKSCRANRLRCAPKAVRTASSCSRRIIRASARLATLAQAISRTSPAVPRRTSSIGRTCRVSCSCSPLIDERNPPLAG